MRLSRALCAAVALVVTLLFAPVALAQTVTVDSVTRTGPGGTTQNDARPPEFNPGGINYADCINDVVLNFNLTIASPGSSDQLEVWAGPPTGKAFTGCLAASARASGGACWPVAKPQAISGSMMTVSVRAQDIAVNLDQTSPPKTYKAATTSQACGTSNSSPGPQTSSPPISLGIYFMLVNGTTVDGMPGEYTFQADILGPMEPANVTLSVGDGNVTVSWSPPSDPDIFGYNVYCQKVGEVNPDALPPPSADTGVNVLDGGTTAGTCPSSVFKNVFTTMTSGTTGVDAAPPPAPDAGTGTDAGTGFPTEGGTVQMVVTTPAGISEIPASYLCASPTDTVDGAMTSGASASMATVALQNYGTYVIAVAAVDTSGNVGPIGVPLTCGTPGPVADFWYEYTKDHGLAGGGYCALDGVGMPVGDLGMAIGMGAALTALARRRRKRR